MFSFDQIIMVNLTEYDHVPQKSGAKINKLGEKADN
jgi:hypothetical protein